MVPIEENINNSHASLPSSFAVSRAEFWILRPPSILGGLMIGSPKDINVGAVADSQ